MKFPPDGGSEIDREKAVSEIVRIAADSEISLHRRLEERHKRQ